MRIYGVGRSEFGSQDFGSDGYLSQIYENAASKWHEMCNLIQPRTFFPDNSPVTEDFVAEEKDFRYGRREVQDTLQRKAMEIFFKSLRYLILKSSTG